MYCTNCGFHLPDGAKFCPNCGMESKRDKVAAPTASPTDMTLPQRPQTMREEAGEGMVPDAGTTPKTGKAAGTDKAQVAKHAMSRRAFIAAALIVAGAGTFAAVKYQADHQDAPATPGQEPEHPKPIEPVPEEPKTYTVAFDGNGANSGSMDTQGLANSSPEALAANAFARAGYDFAGWNTKPDGSGASYGDGAQVTDLAEPGATITLYAQWREIDWLSLYQPTIDSAVATNQRLGENSGPIDGYALLDMDGNGVPELFLGASAYFDDSTASTNGYNVLAIYSLKDGEGVPLFDAALNGMRSYVEEVYGNHFAVYGSGGASAGGHELYRVEGASAVGEYAVVFADNGNGGLYYEYDESSFPQMGTDAHFEHGTETAGSYYWHFRELHESDDSLTWHPL